MIRRSLTVRNQLGLHARAAARFVHTASRFRSHVTAGRDGRTMDGKSILGILLLGAAQGSEIELIVDGPDEAEAIEALAALVAAGFGEGA